MADISNDDRGVSATRSSNRQFAILGGVILAGYAVYLLPRNPDMAIYSFVGAGLLAVLAFVLPSIFGPANFLWRKIGAYLSLIVTPIIMFAVFAVLFVPAGLIRRLVKGNIILTKLDPSVETYWINRDMSYDGRRSLRDQF